MTITCQAGLPRLRVASHCASMSSTASLFLRQFMRSPTTIGAILPSSPALAQAMLAPIDFATARTVVEFGPGTGAFTSEIAKRLRPGCRYLGIELNPTFTHNLTARFPKLGFVNASAADLTHILAAQDIDGVDAIVCGLPWATLPVSLQQAVFAAMDRALVAGGVFVTFGYFQSLVMPAAQALRRRLRHEFADVRRSPVVWANVPPAFAYICRKGKQAFLSPGGHSLAGRLQDS
jgi:phosphatidylethanolamine/phosphatidyl-N-methylethanolamine N-methyltransferase